MPASSPDYCIDVDGKAKWHFAVSNATDQPLNHTLLKTKFTELRDVCCRAYVGVLSSMIDVVDSARAHILAFVAVDKSVSNPLWRNVDVSEFKTSKITSWHGWATWTRNAIISVTPRESAVLEWLICRICPWRQTTSASFWKVMFVWIDWLERQTGCRLWAKCV